MSATQEVGEIFGEGSGPAHAMLRSPTVLIAAVGLWGMNIYFFRLFGIDYVKVLKQDLLKLDGVIAAGLAGNGSNSSGGSNSSSLSASNGGENSNSNYLQRRRRGDEVDKDDDVSVEKGESRNKANAQEHMMLSSEDDMDLIMEANPAQYPYSAITWDRLVGFSVSLLIILHTTSYIWIEVLGGGSIGAVFAFYGAVSTGMVLPLSSTLWLRKSVVIALLRAFELFNPRCSCCGHDPVAGPRPIPFVDVFFADAMCSLSKVFFDWGMLLHMAFYYPHRVPTSAYNILIPSAFAAIPFLVRARQCLLMYTVGRIKNDPKRFSNLWNALKYLTSIFPLCLSAYQKTITPEKAQGLESYLIMLLVINALYALYWDIVMDWGMMQNPTAAVTVVCRGGASGTVTAVDQPRSASHVVLRPRLRFGVLMSAIIVLADAILRFSWILRFYHSIFPSGDSFVLCTQFLEVFRRAIWNLLRVEWENLKQFRTHTITVAPPPSVGVILNGGGGAIGSGNNVAAGAGSGGSATGGGAGSASPDEQEMTPFLAQHHAKQTGHTKPTGGSLPANVKIATA